MNISTLIGIIAALVMFGFSLVTSTDNVMMFLNGHAILIVIGGTAASSLLCYPAKKVMLLLNVFFRRMVGKSNINYGRVIEDILKLSAAMRQSKKAFEGAIAQLKDPFLKDAAEILFWKDSEISPEQLRDLLETRVKTHFKAYMSEADIFRTIAKFPPAFGLMGTTLGMIALLKSLGSPGASASIGPSMAIALIATLYGVALTNLVFVPIAENLSKQTHEDSVSRQMVVEGMMLISDGVPTSYVEAKLNSFLLPSQRPKGGNHAGGARKGKAA
jgi:chemotaxis protein MotA